ncbi:uncharacterized protein JN550_005554 [Neoarthrinium moseri]|uniref:uncharacterized protein n=1 Tax=Neoarthrinium moseri TaxID=1658444 RepID=UPI001FDAEFF5|nr:uncharacterized protein JN550_005554 [Neoarthrinium moseri]KAI1869964.1 hypothetical protein JN550_005554 [Neoarthrinium moseri]
MTTTTTQLVQPGMVQERPAKQRTALSITELQPSTFTQRALIVNHERKYELQDNFTTPAYLSEHEVKIRTCAVGLNQIDYKSVDYNFCLPQLPWITGREMAGVVEEVGSAVQHLEPGHRVWTSTYYRDRRAGCFQESVIVPQHTVSLMSSETSFTSAACLGVCGLTAAMTLWRWFEVPLPYGTPFTPPTTPQSKPADMPLMLIWGGSSVTGQFLTQLAKRSGLRVISVNSAKTAQALKDLGAEHVVARDGRSNEEIIDEVKRIAGDDITMGVDLVGASTALATLQCLSTSHPARFAPLAWAPKVEVADNIEVLNVEMKQFVLNPTSAIYSEQLTRLVESGEIRLPEIEVLGGGLKAVEEGLERLKRGDMAGKKLIVDMQS